MSRIAESVDAPSIRDDVTTAEVLPRQSQNSECGQATSKYSCGVTSSVVPATGPDAFRLMRSVATLARHASLVTRHAGNWPTGSYPMSFIASNFVLVIAFLYASLPVITLLSSNSWMAESIVRMP
jgi:hypothetical protein